jgi:hypothetical protein
VVSKLCSLSAYKTAINYLQFFTLKVVIDARAKLQAKVMSAQKNALKKEEARLKREERRWLKTVQKIEGRSPVLGSANWAKLLPQIPTYPLPPGVEIKREYVVNMVHSVQVTQQPEPRPTSDQRPSAEQRPVINLEDIVLQTVATPSSRKYLQPGLYDNCPATPSPAPLESSSVSVQTSSPPRKAGAGGKKPQGEGKGNRRSRSRSKGSSVASEVEKLGDPLEDLMKASTTIKKPPR